MKQRYFLPTLLIATLVNSQQFPGGNNQRPLQSLGDVLHQVFDKDKNQKVTLDEVNSQIVMLEMLLFQGDGDSGVDEYKQLLSGFKSSAPHLFKLLDSNDDESLSKSEMAYVTKFEKSLKKGGGMRELLRDVFAILDTNHDDQLSVDELLLLSSSDECIAKISARAHDLFPLRNDATELQDFIQSSIIDSIGGSGSTAALDKESITKGMKWIDDDSDGHISRKEIGKYYNLAGKKFMEISKTIKQLGPMMAMFGATGPAGGGDGFKMDL